MMSPLVRSMPVSMSPMRAPLPWLTAYDSADVAWMARMSQLQALRGSGPTFTGTL